MPRRWAYPSASAISRTTRSTWSVGTGASPRSRSSKVSPRTNVMIEEADPLPRVEVIDSHDVGVVERRAQGRLAAEPLVPHRARRDVGGQHLHRHDMTERAVARAEHGAHAADAGEAQYLVAVADGALHGLEVGRLHKSRRMYLRLPTTAACPILGGAMPSVFCRVLGPVR